MLSDRWGLLNKHPVHFARALGDGKGRRTMGAKNADGFRQTAQSGNFGADLDRFSHRWDELLARLITMDESWLYHYDPE